MNIDSCATDVFPVFHPPVSTRTAILYIDRRIIFLHSVRIVTDGKFNSHKFRLPHS